MARAVAALLGVGEARRPALLRLWVVGQAQVPPPRVLPRVLPLARQPWAAEAPLLGPWVQLAGWRSAGWQQEGGARLNGGCWRSAGGTAWVHLEPAVRCRLALIQEALNQAACPVLHWQQAGWQVQHDSVYSCRLHGLRKQGALPDCPCPPMCLQCSCMLAAAAQLTAAAQVTRCSAAQRNAAAHQLRASPLRH